MILNNTQLSQTQLALFITPNVLKKPATKRADQRTLRTAVGTNNRLLVAIDFCVTNDTLVQHIMTRNAS